jgi:hypothetical protein
VSLDTTGPVKKDTRKLAIGLAFAAAALLLFSSVTSSWLVNIGHSVTRKFSLRGFEQCETYAGTSECRSWSNGDFVKYVRDSFPKGDEYTSGAFTPMGWITLIACVIAALALIAAGVLAVMGKKPDLPITPTSGALLLLMVALITGCVFIATKPGPPGFVGVGISFWAFGIGCVMGIFAAQVLAKVNRPPDPDLTSEMV